MRTFVLVSSVVLGLAGCGGAPSPAGPGLGSRADTYDRKWGVSSSRRVIASGPIPKGGGHYKLGNAYQVAGRWYVPRHEPDYDRVGVGSWYGEAFHGRNTANGEVFDMDALTAAHPTLPMPSYAYVTNLRNGRTVLVRINDRGPYVADREIDLSRASARALGYANGGLGQVRVRWAGPAPLDGDDRREQAFLRQQEWFRGAPTRMASIDPSSWSDERVAAPPRPQPGTSDVFAPDRSQRDASGRHDVSSSEIWREPGAPRDDAENETGMWRPTDRREPYDAPAPTPAADTMWSPMEHRQLRSSASRRETRASR